MGGVIYIIWVGNWTYIGVDKAECVGKQYVSMKQLDVNVSADMNHVLEWSLKVKSEVKGARQFRPYKQARTATAVNKQLNFRVKKKPQTTDYVYVLHIWSSWRREN